MQKISNINDLKNGPVIKILDVNMKKLALFYLFWKLILTFVTLLLQITIVLQVLPVVF